MGVPLEYHGREQTYLKHQVLRSYVQAWAQKISSMARTGPVRLWYVDCFAGPWESRGEELQDTSVSIGLQALREAASRWGSEQHPITAGAIFVEKAPALFRKLEEFVRGQAGAIEVHAFQGEFGQRVADIQRLIGHDYAFLFVDPKGWKGVAMKYIAPLARLRGRDVLVNVMIGHLSRFKDAPLDFLSSQMREFFGLREADLPPGMNEAQLIEFYKDRLRLECRLEYVADLIVLDPTDERTRFRLVLGGHHPASLKLFREVEGKVIGKDAAPARQEAKERARLERTQQPTLFASPVPRLEERYAALRQEGLDAVEAGLPALLKTRGPMRYADLWPIVLTKFHISDPDLRNLLWKMKKAGQICLDGMASGDRKTKDAHTVRLPQQAPLGA